MLSSAFKHPHRRPRYFTLPPRLRTAVRALVIACLMAPGAVVAATPPKGIAPHSINSWTTEQGLPQDTVTAILQTQDEYLWIGTEGGLARFDGLRFTVHRTTNTPALTSHSVHALLEDRTGALWIATEAGLVRHRGGSFEEAGLADHIVHAMCEDWQGTLWVATDRGVLRRQGDKFEPLPESFSLPESESRVLFADRQGRVWIGYTGNAGMFCVEADRCQPFDADTELRSEVFAIAQTPDGALWFGSADGLVQWHHGAAQRFNVTDGLAGRKVSCLHVDPAGVLWVASAGLQKITGGEITTTATVAPLTTMSIGSIGHDREGNVWVGTYREGFLRLRQSACQLVSMEARNTETGIRTVMQTPNGVTWLAQGSKGVVRIGTDGEITRTPPASRNGTDEVLGVYAMPGGEVFVGTRGALQIWRNGKIESHPELPDARAFFAGRDGTLWIGLRDNGIVRWRAGALSHFPLPPEVRNCTPSSFAETENGELYIGTWTHGLLHIVGETTSVFNRSSGGPANDMRTVFIDRTGAIWVGARGFGLALLEKDHLLVADWTSELIDQRIDSIIADDHDNLSFGTPRGVFTAPRSELFAAMHGEIPPKRVRLVCVTEGLRSSIDDLLCFPNAWQMRTGQLWYAARMGLLISDPAKTVPNLRPPVVHIERIHARDQRRDDAGQIVLPAGTSGLLIEYAGLNFSAPHRVHYQYKMHGIDSEWIDAGERRAASYASLPPGHYEFQVIACNADGVWNDKGATVAIVQERYFYQYRWPYVVLCVLFAAATYAVSRWRVAALRRDKRRLEQAIEERTHELHAAKELAEASTRAKSEFLQSISHEIRNPLNGVIGLVGILREGPADERQNELLSSLRACAKSLSRVFEEVLRFASLEHGRVEVRDAPFSLGELIADTLALFRVSESGRTRELSLEQEPDVPDQFVGDEEKLQTILANFITNAIKHAPGSPIEIAVSADSINDYAATVTFVVTDYGEGIPPEEQEIVFEKFVRGDGARRQRSAGTGLGLATCRALAELLGGHVGLDSEVGQSTSFFLTLRLKRNREAHALPLLPVERPAGIQQRALVIEDHMYNQIVVRRLVEKLGFHVDAACNAREALPQLDANRYDVIFLDWELPDMTGEEIARNIRGRDACRDTLLIATTAHDSEDIRLRSLAAGFDDFALKPLNVATISRVLADVRRRRISAGTDGRTRLDTRVFRVIGRNRREGVQQAASDYSQTLDQELAALETALDRDDRREVARIAHRLKTHAGLVNAVEFGKAVDRLERMAGTLPAAALAAQIGEVNTLADSLRDQLTQLHPPAAIV